MASSPEPITGKARPARPPISASPAFAWVVALWFAALLGVGSLILPVTMVESASVATGLASIIPQAAPPLGFTAQALLALAGTVGGATLGFVLARRIARGSDAQPAARPARRVLSASEDLADYDSLDEDDDDEPLSAAAPGNRRRSLAMAEDEGPSDFLHVVPLPGSAVLESDRGPAQHDYAAFEEIVEADMPLELEDSAELVEEEIYEPAPRQEFRASEPAAERQEFIPASQPVEPVAAPEPQPVAAQPIAEPLPFSPPSMLRAGVSYDGVQVTNPEPALAAITEVHFEAVEAPHDVRQLFMRESEEDVSDQPTFDAPEAAEPAPSAAAPDEASSDETGSGENGEGLVQLVQRLGATLEKHREWIAEQAIAHPAVAAAEAVAESAVPEEFDPAAPDEAAQAMAAWFGKPTTAAPDNNVSVDAAGLEAEAGGVSPTQSSAPFAATFAAHYDDEDEDLSDLAASFTLPLAIKPVVPQPQPRPAFDRPPVAPAPVQDAAEESEEEDAAASEQFASLNPFKQKGEAFVRIEEPEPEPGSPEPAVLFPGHEARRPAPAARVFDPPGGASLGVAARQRPSNDDNERALREALLNLQRMGK